MVVLALGCDLIKDILVLTKYLPHNDVSLCVKFCKID